MPLTASKILNFLLYQTGWFCCVLGVAKGYPFAGAFVAFALTAIHLLLVEERQNELRLILLTCLIGALVDSVQQALAVLRFHGGEDGPLWLPLWVFAVWGQFATLFRFSLYWLRGRPLLAAALGMCGGPLAYWGGIRLGAAAIGDSPIWSFFSLALVWCVITPLLLWLSRKLNPREGRYRRLWPELGRSVQRGDR